MKIENVLSDNVGFIELVDSMGNDLTIVNAARTSFGKEKKKLTQRDIDLINYLVENKHFSPLRQIQLQFKIKAPEFVTRQFFRHVIGIEYSSYQAIGKDVPWNEQSQRYMEWSNEFYRPNVFRLQSKDNKQASEGELEKNHVEAYKLYNESIDNIYCAYQQLLELGVCKEQARGLLPVSFYTQWVCTMSLQAVANFIMLRDHGHAQFEIRQYAKAMKELTETVVPFGIKALMENMK
jgi:thymidylate synthase (FAD)